MAEPDADAVDVLEDEAVLLEEAVREDERDEEDVRLELLDLLGDALAEDDLEALDEPDAEPELVGLGVDEVEDVAEPDPVEVAVDEGDAVEVGDALEEGVALLDDVGVGAADDVDDDELDGEAEREAVAVGDAVPDAELEGVADREPLGVLEADADPVALLVAEPVEELDAELVADGVAL